MFRRVFKAFDRIAGWPRRIMLGGLVPALLLLCMAAVLYMKPHVSYSTFVLSRHMCRTAVTLFSEGMILGLFLDYLFSGK